MEISKVSSFTRFLKPNPSFLQMQTRPEAISDMKFNKTPLQSDHQEPEPDPLLLCVVCVWYMYSAVSEQLQLWPLVAGGGGGTAAVFTSGAAHHEHQGGGGDNWAAGKQSVLL